jgi:ribosomal protein S27AE
MLLFPIYAMLVWFACYRYRRTFAGFCAVAAGTAGVITIALLERRVRLWLDIDANPLTNLQFLLWIEAGTVGLLGLVCVMAPQHRAEVPCRRCGYELEGLEHENPTCPECGTTFAARRPTKMRCGRCGERSLMDPIKPRCEACARAHDAARIAATHVSERSVST